MINHLTHDIGWPVLALGSLILLGAWRPIVAWWRFEIELYARARRTRRRGGTLDLTPERKIG